LARLPVFLILDCITRFYLCTTLLLQDFIFARHRCQTSLNDFAASLRDLAAFRERFGGADVLAVPMFWRDQCCGAPKVPTILMLDTEQSSAKTT